MCEVFNSKSLKLTYSFLFLQPEIFTAESFPAWSHIGEHTFAYPGGGCLGGVEDTIQIRKFQKMGDLLNPTDAGISFSLEDFHHFMYLKDRISDALANRKIYRESFPCYNFHVSVGYEYIKLTQEIDYLVFKFTKEQWNSLKKVSDRLMYEALYFKFNYIKFRLEKNYEIDIQATISSRQELYSRVKEYFTNNFFQNVQNRNSWDMISFVSVALQIDIDFIESIKNYFNGFIEKGATNDFQEFTDLGDIIQEVCNELCSIY